MDLALVAGSVSGDRRRQATNLAIRQLGSWIEANPPGQGVHYISAMECGLRLIAVCHALDLLRPEVIDDTPWRHLLQIVTSHSPLIRGRLSQYSSAGNHTTAEAAALVYAGVLFPELEDADSWLTKGIETLKEVSSNQVLSDGGGVEQSLAYHRFNIQLLGMVKALLEHHGSSVPCSITAAIGRGVRFLRSMTDSGNTVPPIGDSDDGNALTRLLRPNISNSEEIGHLQTFAEAGYTLVRVPGSPRIRLVMDHGPLGMPPAYGHGHADALSVQVDVGKQELFIDTGTYTYTGDPGWRRYFRSTAAHNTVSVDGMDQAKQEGCFMWSKPYRARLIASAASDSDLGYLLAEHDGYDRLGVHHFRGISWSVNRFLMVWDRLLGGGSHRIDLHWHLAAAPRWSDDGDCQIQIGGYGLHLLWRGGALSTHRGDTDSPAGWRSKHYGSREPITTVRLTHSGRLPHTFSTILILPGCDVSEEELKERFQWFESRIE